MIKKNILFLTGTRADFGKLKPLIRSLNQLEKFNVHIFVTGMHMLSKYGFTADEVRKEGFENIYTFINQTESVPMEVILANTIHGLSNFINEFKMDMIVVHGDRVEPLAGAIVAALNNILVAHIEGGEVSGTIDELLRHSISKLSHLHFVANEDAKKRLMQMGENESSIYVIGSPDIDIMISNSLPSIEEAKNRYDISFDTYAIFSYHPVTTEVNNLRKNIKEAVQAVLESNKKYVVIYPNNDMGTKIIQEEYEAFKGNPNIKVFPSIRFEFFLTLLKNCEFIMGNSSAGIREAEVYKKISINIGSRQNNRHFGENIINVKEDKFEILQAVEKIKTVQPTFSLTFGDGKSAEKFCSIISNIETWEGMTQKHFRDISFSLSDEIEAQRK